MYIVRVFNPNNWMGYLFLSPSKPDYPRPNFEVMLLKSSGLTRRACLFQYPLPPSSFSSIATLSSSNGAISPSSPVQTSDAGVSITSEIAVHDSPLKAAVWQVYDSIFSENQGKLAGGVRQGRRRYTAGNRLLLKPLLGWLAFSKPSNKWRHGFLCLCFVSMFFQSLFP